MLAKRHRRLARTLWLPLFVLQFPLDALLYGQTWVFNSWAWIRALGYQFTHQPWYAMYAERFLIGQRELGEPALWLGGMMVLMQPLVWAVIVTGLWALWERFRGGRGLQPPSP
jgi:hypothetical protein